MGCCLHTPLKEGAQKEEDKNHKDSLKSVNVDGSPEASPRSAPPLRRSESESCFSFNGMDDALPVLSWTKIHPKETRSYGQVPGARRGLSMVSVWTEEEGNGALILFGGVASPQDRPDVYFCKDDAQVANGEGEKGLRNSLASNATYLFNVKEQKWTALRLDGASSMQDVPDPRCSHSAVVYNGGMFVFGTHLRDCDDVFRLDLESGTWSILSAWGNRPLPTGGHSAVVYG
eukprot:Hpha_TRINITY_DN36223_c0_g1::TRINITY_DN36223_c0_g1_i1::g.83254::m.83254